MGLDPESDEDYNIKYQHLHQECQQHQQQEVLVRMESSIFFFTSSSLLRFLFSHPTIAIIAPIYNSQIPPFSLLPISSLSFSLPRSAFSWFKPTSDPVGCIGGPISHVGFEQRTAIERPPKRVRGAESLSRQQHHQLSLRNNFHQHGAGQCGTIMMPNLVSIGLKVSSEEEEHNSSGTYACDRKTAVLPIFSSLSQSLKADIDQQQEEFDHLLRLQEDNMIKGMRELGQRHQISFSSAIETGIVRKLDEKELEIEKMNRKNTELVERIKQRSKEVQSWQCQATYNETVVNALNSNLKQVMAQGIIHTKEGCGDSEVDTAASNANPNHKSVMGANSFYLGRQMICRACKTKEASIMLLPCRHLCLCKDCAGFINACPVYQIIKTTGVEVFTS